MARSLYRYKYGLLVGYGFMSWEAREFARQYSVSQIRTLPYLNSMTRWRRLYVSNLRSRGYGDKEIRDRIYALYDTRDWLTTDGQPDMWAMLRRFRKVAVDEGEYVPPKRKGSHHKVKGISKGDVEGQRKRRKARSIGFAREEMNDRITNAYRAGDTSLAHRLETERNRRFGY